MNVTPAWVLRMEQATDPDGYSCSAFEANSVAREWRNLRDEIRTLCERLADVKALLRPAVELREKCVDEHGNSISENVRMLFFKHLTPGWYEKARELTEQSRTAGGVEP